MVGLSFGIGGCYVFWAFVSRAPGFEGVGTRETTKHHQSFLRLPKKRFRVEGLGFRGLGVSGLGFRV